MKLTQKPVLFYCLLLLSVVLLALSTLLFFMRSHNQTIAHPLPVNPDNGVAVSEDEEAPKPEQALHIVANHELKQPLGDILSKFSHYYPHITATVSYVDTSEMRSFVSQNPDTHVVLTDAPTMQGVEASFKANSSEKSANTDSSLSEKDITPPFDFAMSKSNAGNDGSKIKFQGYVLQPIEDTATKDSNGSSAAMIFKRFLLASSVQKILKSSDLESIETYKNSVDELFDSNANSDVEDVTVKEMFE